MTDKLNINLRIAGVVLSLTINRDEEERLREVAKEVNHVYDTYRARFANSSALEVLAKVTLLFAQGYLGLAAQNKEIEATLASFEHDLDSLIADSETHKP